MDCDVPAALRVLFVGSTFANRARVEEHLALADDAVQFDVCTDGADEALAIAARAPIDALLVGPIAELWQLPVQLVSRLIERDNPPVFLLLGAAAWSVVDWSSLPLAGVDAVLEWEACRGARLHDLLRYNIARAHRVARTRAACVRSETMTAAVAQLAEARGRPAVCAVAVEAAAALRASGCGVLLAEGSDLVLVQAHDLPDDEARVLARCSTSVGSHAVAEAARTRRPTWSRGPHRLHQGALPLVADDELLGVLWVRTRRAEPDDVTSLERLAAHFARALARCAESARMAERALHAERLVAITAHDLRSPLQVIAMGAGLLRLDGAVMPAKRFLVDRINESSERAGTLVEELLAVANTTRDDGGAGLQVASVFDLLRASVQDFQLRMPDCPIALSTRGSGDAAIVPDHVTQVLHNLLGNAAHYRTAGSTVTVRGIGATERVYLEVHNDGPVIRDEQIPDLFAPMKRGTASGERGSVGLGLYIVKTLVEGDGGRVWVRSSADEGTTFVVALPRTARRIECEPMRKMLEPYRVRPASIPPAYASLLERLPEGPLVKLLGVWLELGGASHLPHPRQLDRTRLLAHLPEMFWVDVLGACEGNLQFRLLEIGGMLERRLDGHAPDEVLHIGSDANLRPSMRAAYERCASTRRPAFDYIKSGGSDRGRASFTRLVLPFSRDGEHVTQLIGMALFRGFEEASRDARSPFPGALAPCPPPDDRSNEDPS
ncbi:MAG: GAF domain-containing sensor histidine kinase [Polyangiales bacterium]